jgi:uncharacterized protein
MTIHTKHEPGMFSWSDLNTSDPAAAKKFYGELFGWTTEDMPAGPDMVYSMCKLGGHDAAAISGIPKEQKAMGIPPHWNVYFTVTDLDETAKRVEPAGGKVLAGPFDVMDVGRMAIVQDPTGSTACLWQAKKHIGAQVTNEHGASTWAELLTNDVDAAGKFWVAVMGWKTEAFGGAYTIFKAGDKSSCGMMAIGADMKGVPPHWVAYFQVNDADAIAKKATELGGKVYVPPQDIPSIGRFSVIADGQGASFGVLQPKG